MPLDASEPDKVIAAGDGGIVLYWKNLVCYYNHVEIFCENEGDITLMLRDKDKQFSFHSIKRNMV